MRSGMEIKIRATINSTARAPSAENKDVNKFDSPKLCVEQLQTKRGKCWSDMKIKSGATTLVPADFNIQKISGSNSFPNSFKHIQSASKASSLRPVLQGNSSSKRLSYVNTSPVLDGNASQNQLMKPSGLRMPSPPLSFFSQPKRSMFQDLPLRGNENIVCGSQKPENSSLQDNLRRTPVERIPMQKISDISKNRFGELHKVDIELPSVGGSCEQVIDGKVNWKTIEGYRDSACKPYHQLHRKTTDPCVFEGASTPRNNLGDGLNEKNGLSVPPQNAIPFSDEWLIDIEAARKERERRQIQVVGTSFEKVLSGTTVAAAVRETPVVLWRHGSMLIAGSFEGNVIISADTRSTTEEPKRKKGLKGNVTIDDCQSKINRIKVHGDQILAAFVGDNGLYDLAVDHVTTICEQARWKRVPISLIDLAKQIYIQLKEVKLTEKNQGVDILLATFVNKEVSMVKIVVNPPHTRNEHPPGAFVVTSEELKNIVVLGADQKLVKTMIKKRHKKVKDFAGFKDMVIHGVLISSLAHGCTGGAIEAWQMRNGWMEKISPFPVIKQYLERFRDLENENKALLIIVPTHSSSKITCGDIVIQFRCGRVQPICMFLGRINNLDIFRLWFRRVEDATSSLEGLEEFNSISRIPKFESYVLSQVGKVGCLVKIAKRQFVEHLLFRLKKSVEYGPHSGDLSGLLTEKKFSLHGRIK